jgi:MFS family permease
MQVKSDVTLGNVFTLPYLLVFNTSVGAYVNCQIIFMLQDTAYFNVDPDEVGRTTSQLIFWGLIVSLFLQIGFGYAYDIFGRRALILASTATNAAVLYFIPYTSPSLLQLQMCLILVRICLSVIHANPLIVDYIKKDSRGKAIAFTNMGIVVGEFFSMGLMLSLTIEMSYEKAFLTASVIMGLLVLPLFCIVREKNRSTKIK